MEEPSVIERAEATLAALKEQNEECLSESEKRIADYTQLLETLERLPRKTSHPVLAPICGGLAYLDGQLVHTNEILVLLGDNWFVERSAAEAGQIATCRLEFLKNEKAQLESSRDGIALKQKLLCEEEILREDMKERVFDDGVPDGGATSQEYGGDDLTIEELAELEDEIGEEFFDDEALERKIVEFRARKRLQAIQQRSSQHPHSRSSPAFTNPSDIYRKYQQSALKEKEMEPTASSRQSQPTENPRQEQEGPPQKDQGSEAHHHSCAEAIFRERVVRERTPADVKKQHMEAAAAPSKKKQRSIFWHEQLDDNQDGDW